jgi:hypothetical protein
VEVDIVMDGNTQLWKAHDVSQRLQDKIEVLPNVERAFVHVDHEWTHIPVCCPSCFIPSHSTFGTGTSKTSKNNNLRTLPSRFGLGLIAIHINSKEIL